MKTLFIASYRDRDWRKHAHVVSWLRSIGYEITVANINDVQNYAISHFQVVLVYHVCLCESPVSNQSETCLFVLYKELIDMCVNQGAEVFGITTCINNYTKCPESKQIQFRFWNIGTMDFFKTLFEQWEQVATTEYKPP